ncbi:MAG: hypothetical protein JSR54_00520 [Proteobacteria bacterium]|nr:hypothetical protein [Pseudomonadota bacterium]
MAAGSHLRRALEWRDHCVGATAPWCGSVVSKKEIAPRAEPGAMRPVPTGQHPLGSEATVTRRLVLIAAWSSAAAAVAGCAGNGAGLDANGRPGSSTGAVNGPLTADFASIQSHVFTPICTVCHAGAAAPQGLRLDAANSYALLVGVPSTEVPALLRVKAGDPDNSYLVQKLEGHAAVGARMPFGGPYLDQATIDVIRQWITDGAAPPAATAAPPGFAITAVTPAPGDAVDARPSIVLALSQDLDQTRIDASSLRLERVGPSGAAAGSVPLRLRVPAGNPRALLALPLSPLAPGIYRLVVPAPPDTGLASIGGERLGARGDAQTLTEFEVVPPT